MVAFSRGSFKELPIIHGNIREEIKQHSEQQTIKAANQSGHFWLDSDYILVIAENSVHRLHCTKQSRAVGLRSSHIES